MRGRGSHRSRRGGAGGYDGCGGGGMDGGRAIDGRLDDSRREIYGGDYVEGAAGPRVRDGDGGGPACRGTRIYGRRPRMTEEVQGRRDDGGGA